jgi:hypothetical protein
MWQDRQLSDDSPWSDEEQDRNRIRDNFLAAIVTATLVVTGAWLTDELTEDSQGCYRPDARCRGARAHVTSCRHRRVVSAQVYAVQS